MPNQPRNTFGRFRSASEAIVDITFEPSADAPEDLTSWLGGGTMVVEFQARGTYRYENVNFVEYTNFKNSPSWGEYFNDYIRPFYNEYERIA